MHELLGRRLDLVEAVRKLAAEADVPADVSVLRILDVLLWIRGGSHGEARRQRGAEETE